jgi:hypothetical protein
MTISIEARAALEPRPGMLATVLRIFALVLDRASLARMPDID